MAWQKRTTCQQCEKKLAPTERRLGTLCDRCVKHNGGKVWDNSHTEENDNEE